MVLFERKNAFLYMILEWKRFILHHEGRPLLRSHVGDCQRFGQYDVKSASPLQKHAPGSDAVTVVVMKLYIFWKSYWLEIWLTDNFWPSKFDRTLFQF